MTLLTTHPHHPGLPHCLVRKHLIPLHRLVEVVALPYGGHASGRIDVLSYRSANH